MTDVSEMLLTNISKKLNEKPDNFIPKIMQQIRDVKQACQNSERKVSEVLKINKDATKL